MDLDLAEAVLLEDPLELDAGHDIRHFAVAILALRFVEVGADGQYDRSDPKHLVRAALELGFEVADEAADGFHLGTGEDSGTALLEPLEIVFQDLGSRRHVGIEVLEVRCRQPPPDVILFLHQGDLKALDRQVRRRPDTRDPAADHQRRLDHRSAAFVQRLQMTGSSNAHADQRSSLFLRL